MRKREFADFLTYTLAASGARGMELKEREEIDAYISKYRKPKHQ